MQRLSPTRADQVKNGRYMYVSILLLPMAHVIDMVQQQEVNIWVMRAEENEIFIVWQSLCLEVLDSDFPLPFTSNVQGDI